MTDKTDLVEYVCHKKVKAGKITAIALENRSNGHAMLTLDGIFNVNVSRSYLEKHSPQIGGYYVLYADGYESFSPAEAFESGYSKIE